MRDAERYDMGERAYLAEVARRAGKPCGVFAGGAQARQVAAESSMPTTDLVAPERGIGLANGADMALSEGPDRE